ncbi:MAG: MBL fold metallo-hydrolase [Gemmatimonadota bacterium]|nr:MAG: MBL fold metallo-hydrolase [Gemmatimonadota bacterium]
MKRPNIQFLGAAGTVTGSKHLVTANGSRILLDCGLFQGLKPLRMRNWAAPPVTPSEVDAVVLSHAHLDHSGYLPLFVRLGFAGPIYCTSATRDLLGILLRDSAYLQEEQAAHANRFRYSKHEPALPLYTMEDVEQTLPLLEARQYREPFTVTDGVCAVYRCAGHILGSATVELQLGGKSKRRIVYSGDLGRWGRPILKDPGAVPEADVLLVESTYGDRTHAPDPNADLARVIRETAERGAALIVPAFAVGRSQELLWRIRELEVEDRIPTIPVYMDSPMAIDVTDIYRRHPEEHDLEMASLMNQERRPLRPQLFSTARTALQSKALNDVTGPMVLISASGMASGGRVLHHLKRRLPDRRTTVLFCGYQAAGTRGRSLQDGALQVRIHGQQIAVHARVETLHGLSAHADWQELLTWMAQFERPPRRTYAVHGEPSAAQSLVDALEVYLGWRAEVATEGGNVTV